MKAGQFVGSMKNVPQEFVTVLSVLQDKVRVFFLVVAGKRGVLLYMVENQ